MPCLSQLPHGVVLLHGAAQSGVALTPVQSGAPSALTQPGACSAISSASSEDGEDRSRTGVPIQPQEVVAVQPGLECEQPEEVALLILAAVKGLEQDVKWMVSGPVVSHPCTVRQPHGHHRQGTPWCVRQHEWWRGSIS